MDAQDIVSKLEDLSAEYSKMLRAQGAHECDWGPLEKFLPYKWCGGFMFMGYAGKIRLYKHGLTRRYLNLDPEGNAYLYDSDSDSYFKVARKKAIAHVYDGLEEMGYPRTTKLTEEVMSERRRRLEEAGYTVVVMKPDGA